MKEKGAGEIGCRDHDHRMDNINLKDQLHENSPKARRGQRG